MFFLSFQSKRDRGTQTAKDPLTCETEKLAFDIIYFNLGKRSPSQYDDDVVKCLRHLVQKILHKHSITMNALMSRISLDRQTDLQAGFDALSEEIFQNQITWSRIATFFAFGAKLAMYCADNGLEDLIIEVAAQLAHHAVEKLTPFLRDNGGWVCILSIRRHGITTRNNSTSVTAHLDNNAAQCRTIQLSRTQCSSIERNAALLTAMQLNRVKCSSID